MILKAYSFFDTKVGLFSAPMFFAHEGYAMRAAVELGSDLGTSIGRHPADYHLYMVGEFNDNTGLLSVVGPVSLGPVLSLLPKQAPLFEAEEI